MENKQTAPKELWVTRLEDLHSKNHIECRGILTLNKGYLGSIKYLSESHVFEILDAKDKQIDGQRRIVQSFKDRYEEQIELIYSKKKEIESKDKEITGLATLLDERNAYIVEKEREIERLKKENETFKKRFPNHFIGSGLNLEELSNKVTEAIKKETPESLNTWLDKHKENNTHFCECEEPDREPGFTYCMYCHKHVSEERINEIIKNQLEK